MGRLVKGKVSCPLSPEVSLTPSTLSQPHTHTLTERAREREIPTEGTRVKETQNLMDSKAQQPL